MNKSKVEKTKELSLEEVMFAFRRRLSSLMRKETEEFHYPLSQIDTLMYISEMGSPTMKDVAKYLNITPPSATAIIEAMQEKKLITRLASDKDRRTVRVTLTPKARIVFKSLHKRKLDIFSKMLSKLDDEQRKQFIKILNILVRE